jgi:hypothetical protein
MFDALRVGRTEECASDLELDAWLASELGARERKELSAHVAGCERCRARRASLMSDRECFARGELSVPSFLDPPERSGVSSIARLWWKTWWKKSSVRWLSGSCAAAAVLGLLMLAAPPPWSRRATSDAGLRSKGHDYVSFYVLRGDAVHRGQARERVRSGDRLRFVYTASGPRYLAILSLDGARNASVYFPASSDAAPIVPGIEVPLPSAVELDAVQGEERILALFCDRALPIEPLRAELEREQQLRAPSGCTLDQLVLFKEAP